jgi:hypothetical protein
MMALLRRIVSFLFGPSGCKRCGKELEPKSPYAPFCGEICRGLYNRMERQYQRVYGRDRYS